MAYPRIASLHFHLYHNIQLEKPRYGQAQKWLFQHALMLLLLADAKKVEKIDIRLLCQ